MPKPVATICLVALVTVAFAGWLGATCGEDCGSTLQSETQSCHQNYGQDPEEANDLATCIQNAQDGYQSCLQDCADQGDSGANQGDSGDSQ